MNVLVKSLPDYHPSVLLPNVRVLSDGVQYVDIDVLELKNLKYVDITKKDEDAGVLDSDEEDNYHLEELLRVLKHHMVIINFTGIKSVNEVVIKKILHGSLCRVVMFRCKDIALHKVRQDMLKRMMITRKYVGLKGYLGASGFQV